MIHTRKWQRLDCGDEVTVHYEVEAGDREGAVHVHIGAVYDEGGKEISLPWFEERKVIEAIAMDEE